MRSGPDDGAHPASRIRIALLARDRRFLRVTSFLLARSGFAAGSAQTARSLFDLMDEIDANIVVVDGTESLRSAARVTAALSTHSPRVGVVVVSEDPEAGGHGVRAVPKWSSFDQLVEEIEYAYKRCRDAPLSAPL